MIVDDLFRFGLKSLGESVGLICVAGYPWVP